MGSVLFHQQADQLDPDVPARLQEAAGSREVLITTDSTVIQEKMDDIEVLAGHVPAELLFAAENCRWLQIFSAGADNLLMKHPQARDRDFQLTNVSGIHAISITEHIFSLLLTLARDIDGAIRVQKDRNWRKVGRNRDRRPVQEVAGSTLCLLGVGNIGRRVALAARAFDMRVVAVRRHYRLALPQAVEACYGLHNMAEALAQADWVVCCLPHTRETHEAIGADQFRAMQSGAYFINIGRGKVVKEPDLVQALAEGGIKGAGLDVTYEEPNPDASPLWDMDNVVLTSHYSGLSVDYGCRACEIFIDNLQRYVEGRPLRNLVDKQLGY